MKIKLFSFFLFLFLFNLVSAQDSKKLALADKAQTDCKDLIFNTLELTPFEFNERCRTESYPFLSEDGIDLYFTHDQSYDWLFYSQREISTGKWTVPVPLTISNFSDEIRSSYLTNDKKILYFTSNSKLYKCYSVDSSRTVFNQVQEIEINSGNSAYVPMAYLSFSDDFTTMYAMSHDGSKSSMCEYTLSGDNIYTYNGVISTTNNEMGYLSNDGLVYYYTNHECRNILFCRLRSTTQEAFSTKVHVAKIFESQLDIGQIRIAEKEGLMAVVLTESVWSKNDLYFTSFNASDTARNFQEFDITNFKAKNTVPNTTEKTFKEVTTTLPVKKHEIINSNGNELCKIELGQTFPNPAMSTFYFYYSVSAEDMSLPVPVVKVLDNAGRVVYSHSLEDFRGEAKVILEDVVAGQYLVKIEYNGISSETIRVSVRL